MSYYVKIHWDAEALVWYVEDSNVPGLCTEAPTIDAIMTKLDAIVPDLLATNCGEHNAAPFTLIAQRQSMCAPFPSMHKPMSPADKRLLEKAIFKVKQAR